MSTIQSKSISTTVVKKTLVYETENHLFKVSSVNINDNKIVDSRLRGTVEHKDGTRCGDFTIDMRARRQLSININSDCKDLLVDFVSFVNAINNNEFTEVEEFAYVAEKSAE